MDLNLGYNTEDCAMDSMQFEYLSLITAYMLHTLGESQSMAKLGLAFKSVTNRQTKTTRTTQAQRVVMAPPRHHLRLERQLTPRAAVEAAKGERGPKPFCYQRDPCSVWNKFLLITHTRMQQRIDCLGLPKKSG